MNKNLLVLILMLFSQLVFADVTIVFTDTLTGGSEFNGEDVDGETLTIEVTIPGDAPDLNPGSDRVDRFLIGATTVVTVSGDNGGSFTHIAGSNDFIRIVDRSAVDGIGLFGNGDATIENINAINKIGVGFGNLTGDIDDLPGLYPTGSIATDERSGFSDWSDGFDELIWCGSTGGGHITLETNAVPEPSTWIMIMISCLCFCRSKFHL